MKKKGFTLIELLAVIIILGILMLIAIPSVTSYINNSRKNTYVSTIHEVVKGTVARVNNGDLDMYDTDTTYYIPASAINLEGDKLQSPYGEIDDAYVVVTYDGESYDYYFVGKDKANMGVGTLTQSDKINKDSIGEVGTIDKTVGIGGRSKIVVFDKDLVAGTAQGAQSQGGSGGSNGSSGTVCKRATTLHSANGNTYGNLGSGGTINVGDAFDCDVNGDGTYDAATERFYYITSANNVGVLLYYSNVRHNGTPTKLAYYSYNEFFSYDDYYDPDHESPSVSIIPEYGPLTAVGRIETMNANFDAPLPSTSKWSNVRLSNTTRQIGSLSFSYEGFAARILSSSEFISACGSGNFVSTCRFALERTAYDNDTVLRDEIDVNTYSDTTCTTPGQQDCNYRSIVNDGFILEDYGNNGRWDTSYYVGVSYDYNSSSYISGLYEASVGGYGIRPAIEVPLTQIQL